jgi:hypothetical protein
MKLICDAAESNGIPDDSLLMVFTKPVWMTRRPMFGPIRTQMLGSFENIAGILITSNEFFDVKSRWPLGFSVWRYKSKAPTLDADRNIPLIDLTWLTKKQLAEIAWHNPNEMEQACQAIWADTRAVKIELGTKRTSIREWSAKKMLDFKRDRRRTEQNYNVVGGLPTGDRRRAQKKTYGETEGRYIGLPDVPLGFQVLVQLKREAAFHQPH